MTLSAIALVTGVGTVAALAVWMAVARAAGAARLAPRRLLLLVLGVGLACRIAFALLTPTFYAPDEQSHFKYIRHLAVHHTLPVQTSRTGSPTEDWEYYQPPLYYAVLAPLYAASDGIFHDDAATLRVLRAGSILLWMLTVWLAFRLLAGLTVRDDFVRTFVIAMAALLPTYVFISSALNNDNLVIALGAGILVLALRPMSLTNSVWTGLLLGLALLTKLTAVVFAPMIVLLLLARSIRGSVGRAGVFHVLLQLILAAALWAPWAWRAHTLYGSVSAEEIANVRQVWKSAYHAVAATLDYMQDSFWAVSGIYNDVNRFYPVVGRHLGYLAVAGLAYGWVARRDRLDSTFREHAPVLGAWALTLGIHVALIFRFGLLYGQGQGRFLFPMLLPIALFLGLGLRVFRATDAKSSAAHVAGGFIAYAVSFTVFSLAMFSRG